MLSQDVRISAVCQATVLSHQTILRIKADPIEAERIVARWAEAEEMRR
jgi:putative DNA-invertase from lambdoid prophage Rac